jgi:hypothetical protein
MRLKRRISSSWWIAGGGLLLALCGFAPRWSAQERNHADGSSSFVGIRVRCVETTEVFTQSLRPSVVPFASTVFDFGGFTLAGGRVKVPEDGMYVVEAGVSSRFRSAIGQPPAGIRMTVRSATGVVAAATGPRVNEEERSTSLSASAICGLKRGDEVFVELSTDALADGGKDYPVLTGESGDDVCHLSIAMVGRVPSGSK